MAIKVTEEMHPEKEWFEQAGKQTLKTLPDFINHVMNDYCHDYGTVCHAVAACAIAAAWAANNESGSGGGITGFQAGFVMWDFIKQWNYSSNKCGMKIIDYDNMLFPQYEDRFSKTISKDLWGKLQEEARKNLDTDRDYTHPSVIAHWQSIVNGKVPFGYVVKEGK